MTNIKIVDVLELPDGIYYFFRDAYNDNKCFYVLPLNVAKLSNVRELVDKMWEEVTNILLERRLIRG